MGHSHIDHFNQIDPACMVWYEQLCDLPRVARCLRMSAVPSLSQYIELNFNWQSREWPALLCSQPFFNWKPAGSKCWDRFWRWAPGSVLAACVENEDLELRKSRYQVVKQQSVVVIKTFVVWRAKEAVAHWNIVDASNANDTLVVH